MISTSSLIEWLLTWQLLQRLSKEAGKEPCYNKGMTSYTIERKSPLTGKINTMEITMDPNDYLAWKNGEMIQNALPYLTTDEREFIKTGLVDDEWDVMTSTGPWTGPEALVSHIERAETYNNSTSTRWQCKPWAPNATSE